METMNVNEDLFESYIERVSDGQGGHVWEVTVLQNGEIIATDRYTTSWGRNRALVGQIEPAR